MKKTKWITTFTVLYMAALLALVGCDNNAGGKTPSTPLPPAPQGMTLAEATAAIKAIPATFDASNDEPLQIVFAGDVTGTEAEGTAFYNAMKAAPDASVAIDMEQADMTEIPDYMFAYCNSLDSVILPKNAKSIGEYTFINCYNLAEIIIPNSVTSIGVGTFSTCTSLTEVVIPNNVASIGDGTFYRCISLTKIIVADGNQYYHAEKDILYNKNKTKLIAWPTASGTVSIPDTVTSIGNKAFSGCELTKITIPNSVTSIGDSTFSVCDMLTEVIINRTEPPTIGNDVFAYPASIYVPATSVDAYKTAWTEYASKIRAIGS